MTSQTRLTEHQRVVNDCRTARASLSSQRARIPATIALMPRFFDGKGTEQARAWGQRIREARRARGWTQAELAERVDMTSNTVSRAEQGVYEVPAATRRRIAEALDLPMDAVGLDAGAVAPTPVRPTAISPIGRYPHRVHAEALFREEASELGYDQRLVDETVEAAATMALESDNDPTIRAWAATMHGLYHRLRLEGSALAQDVDRRRKDVELNAAKVAEATERFRPRLPPRR